jgi:hypothetical protein
MPVRLLDARQIRVRSCFTSSRTIAVFRPVDALDSLINWAGGREVEVGDAVFDRRFVIRSRDEQVYYARNEKDPEHRADSWPQLRLRSLKKRPRLTKSA